MTDVFDIKAPEYQVTPTLQGHEEAGMKIDAVLYALFQGREIVLRGFSSEEHGTTLDDAVNEILMTGWDRNGQVTGKGYEEVDCDLFAWKYTVEGNPMTFRHLEKSYGKTKAYTGTAHRFDVFVAYDPDQLEQVTYLHKGKLVSDAYRFRNPDDKIGAVLAVIKITE